MYRAILFDLDDTLLSNPIRTFVPAYFQLIGDFMEPVVPREKLISELIRGTKAMERNPGAGVSNEEAFSRVFYPSIGVEKRELKQHLETFYTDRYPRLAELTGPAPGSLEIVEWAFEQGLDVVIATNPIFPLSAIHQRLEWAGLPVNQFRFTLVTSYENMHAAKPNPAYYREILEYLGRKPEECLMVGDDWDRDIAPAFATGLEAYWVRNGETGVPQPADLPSLSKLLLGSGSLGELLERLAG